MAASAGTVTLNLDANSVKLLRELQKSERASRKTSRQIGQDFAKMGAAIGASAAAAAGALAAITKASVAYGDEVAKTAKVVGVNVESLQELRFAAEQTGVGARGLDDSLRRLGRRAGEFVNSGAGPAQKAFEKMNISVRDVNGNVKDTETLFNDIVKAARFVKTDMELAALAAQLFGDDFGPKMVPLIRQGAEGIENFRMEARKLGLVLSADMAANAEELADKMNILNRALKIRVSSAVLENAEAIGTLTDALVKLAGVAGGAVSNIGLVFSAITGNLGDKRELEKLRVDSQKLDLELITIQRRRETALKSGSEKTVAIFDAQIADIRARRSRLQEEIKRLTIALNPPGGFFPTDAPDDAGGDDPAQKAADFIGKLEDKLRGLVLSDAGAIEVELRLLGANDQQIQQAIALASGIKAIEEANEALNASEAETQKQTEARAGIISDLEAKVQSLALSEAALLEIKLRGLGASDEEVAQALALTQGIEDLTAANEALQASEAEIAALFESTRTPIERYTAEIERLAKLTEEGLDADTYSRGVEQAAEAYTKATEVVTDMTVFAEQAARNIQDSLAQFLFDPFDAGLKGMLSGFIDTMRRMVAEIASQAILRQLFQGFAGKEGFLGAMAGALGLEPKAMGGPVSAGGTYLVGERGPEVLQLGASSGFITPNHALGGGQIVVNIDARESDDPARLLSLVPVIQMQIEQSMELKRRRGY